MVALTNIPYGLDIESLLRKAHISAGSEDGKDFEQRVETARAVGAPKAMYRECFVEARGKVTVTIEGVTFTSRILRRNLDKVERVFPFVATCGVEMDEACPTGDDILKGFWWDLIKASLLSAAIRFLNQEIARRHAFGKTVSMSPGSGDVNMWPIEQQREAVLLCWETSRGGSGWN